MAEETALVYKNNLVGTETIYLAGGGSSQTPYTGSGTPWDTQTTTPFELSLVDNNWTAAPATTTPIYGGGPPFRPGRALIAKSYDNVTETVGIQMRATTFDNVAALLRLLRRALNTAQFDVPCRLLHKPNGSNLSLYYAIYHADVVETPSYIIESSTGAFIIRATITWTRSPFGSTIGAGTSAFSSQSFGNLGTGSPDNIVPYTSSQNGDLIYEGQPCNITFDPVGTAATIWLASVYSRAYSTTGSGSKTTSSTSGASATLNTPVVDTVISNNGVKGRVLIRLTSSTTANAQLRLEVRITSSGTLIHTSPWITPTSGVATVVDLGYVPLDAIRRAGGAVGVIQLSIGYRSTNGASSTIAVASNDFLLYYEFCKISATIGASSPVLQTKCIPEDANRPNILDRPEVAMTTSGGSLVDFGTIRGTLPRVRSGASLYAAWLQSGSVHDSTDTASVSVAYGPQYHTLIGNN